MSPSDLAAFRDELVRVDLCSLRSQRLGEPDEGRPTLEVDLPPVRCTVQLWDGEWRERAPSVLRHVESLRDRARR